MSSSTMTTRLRDLAGGAESPLLAGWAAHTRAVADADLPAIEAAGETFEAMGMHLLAAETWAEAAQAAQTASLPGRAARASARSEVLTDSCPGAATPLLETLCSPIPLTPREREVAGLAASGRSSRAIADELDVSVRTVDGHLEHVYRKLGVSRRQELGPLLRTDRRRETGSRLPVTSEVSLTEDHANPRRSHEP